MTGVSISSGSLTLKNPDNSVLKGPQAFATAPTFIDPITLTQTGVYTLVLDPKGKAKGSVTLTGYDVPADTSAALTLGSQATGTTTVPGQRNKFTFSGTLNQRISLSVLSSDFSGTISLLKPDLSVLASTPVGPAGGFLDTTVLPVAGTYTFVIDPSGATTGSISFTAYDVPADPSSAITAGGPAVTLTTTVAGQNANATFTGTAGQKVSVLVSNVVNVDPAELDLLKPDGSHAIPAPVTVTNAGAWMQTVTLPVNGVYKILLDPQLANTGSADVQLFIVPADLSGPITPGTPLTVTTTAPGQNATYTFTGTINTRVSLNLTAVSIENLKVSVLKPDGTNLIVKTVGTSGGFGDPVKLPVGGTYKVFVDPQSSFYGSVTVGLYVVPADTTGTAGPRHAAHGLDDRARPERDAHLQRDRGSADQLQLHRCHDGERQGDREGTGNESPDGPPAHLRHGRRLRRPGDAARGPHRPVHRDDRPAGRIDRQRDADVLQRPRRRERLDELREHRPWAELQAHAHGQLGNAHGDGDDERPCRGRPDAERLAHDLPGHDDHAGEPGRLRHRRTYRQRLRGLFPGERHVHDRGRPVRRGNGHDLRSDLLGSSGQPAS